MSITVNSWEMTGIKKPVEKSVRTVDKLESGQALVKVAGCGVCHTDISFLYFGVKTKKELPLTLGHEISGEVIDVGSDCDNKLKGKSVVIPAVLPCGECYLCKNDRGNMCLGQIMPGNDIHGGFADYITVPSKYLCTVSDDLLKKYELKELSVIADAVTTPYQSVKRSGLKEGDLAIFIGVGGIGVYGVQIAASLGAKVIAIDIDDNKLEKIKNYGASAVLNVKGMEIRDIKKTVKGLSKEIGGRSLMWKIFETSGTHSGQELAFALLNFAGTLAIVGFTMDKLNIRLSNLMAFDATVFGNWGCLPEYYTDVLNMLEEEKINIKDFSCEFPMSQINEVFEKAHHGQLDKRAILVPDF